MANLIKNGGVLLHTWSDYKLIVIAMSSAGIVIERARVSQSISFLFAVMIFHIHLAEIHEEVLRYLPVSGIIGLNMTFKNQINNPFIIAIFFHESRKYLIFKVQLIRTVLGPDNCYLKAYQLKFRHRKRKICRWCR